MILESASFLILNVSRNMINRLAQDYPDKENITKITYFNVFALCQLIS